MENKQRVSIIYGGPTTHFDTNATRDISVAQCLLWR